MICSRIGRKGERVKMLWWISRWGMSVGGPEVDNKQVGISPLGESGGGRSDR